MNIEVTKSRFILSDEFYGDELLFDRKTPAHLYLSGEGIEIGALHKPLEVDREKCSVKYIDYKTFDENRLRYPELEKEAIVFTDIVDDGFTLNKIEDNSQNFIIANHALEHSPDPYGTLLRWLSKLKVNGVIYAAIPIGEKCYDQGRPNTTVSHLYADHEMFISLDKQKIERTTREHLKEFIEISDKNIRILNQMDQAVEEEKTKLCNDLMVGLEEELKLSDSYDSLIEAHIRKINRIYDIHYHVFSPSGYEFFLETVCRDTSARLENVMKNGSGECIGIIRKTKECK